MRVAVIGAGYVGLTTAAVLAYLGNQVVAAEKDPARLALLQRGRPPFHEPGVEQMLAGVGERLSFTGDTAQAAAEADVIFITVGTPASDTGLPDLSFVYQAAEEIAAGLQPGRSYTVVVKSTVPVGTNRIIKERIQRLVRERFRWERPELAFVSNPEFLREGQALSDSLYPDRIVVASDGITDTESLEELYEPVRTQSFPAPPFLPRPEGYTGPAWVEVDVTSAELIKYGSNAFLALKISFANELAGLCERVGADIRQVAYGMGLDHRIGLPFLGAGIGWGGSCFPKDTQALLATAAEQGYSMPILEAARAVNARQPQRVIEKLQQALHVLRGRTVGVLGLAFKPGTDDVRESPAIAVIQRLLKLGARVRVHDPAAMANARQILGTDVTYCETPYQVAEGCDALVLATEWDLYRHLDLTLLADLTGQPGPVLVDGRNIYSPYEAIKKAGFRYYGIGRCS